MAIYTSMSFKEIAKHYNAINFIPEKSATEIGECIRDLIGRESHLLDMGAGAGRISVSIAKAGARVTALDIEPEMLAVAGELAASMNIPITLVEGDVTTLPFASNSFDAVFTSNVLHLVSNWKTSLREVQRVLKPGGLFIQGRDWLSPNAFASEMKMEFRKIVALLNPEMLPTAAAGPMLFQELHLIGAEPASEIIASAWTEEASPLLLFEKMKNRTYNETWQLEEPLFSESLRRFEAWLKKQPIELSHSETIQRRFVLYISRGLKS
ncbi:MAG: class I SAM-dependent methyltransferase [Chloroherpetonaceae bacterium]|nr:class I SAM-dependent methyltransferase [Chloroherpetonaceae bacterium]